MHEALSLSLSHILPLSPKISSSTNRNYSASRSRSPTTIKNNENTKGYLHPSTTAKSSSAWSPTPFSNNNSNNNDKTQRNDGNISSIANNSLENSMRFDYISIIEDLEKQVKHLRHENDKLRNNQHNKQLSNKLKNDPNVLSSSSSDRSLFISNTNSPNRENKVSVV
jgi:hypothetical protein